jgi:hypothetical protein
MVPLGGKDFMRDFIKHSDDVSYSRSWSSNSISEKRRRLLWPELSPVGFQGYSLPFLGVFLLQLQNRDPNICPTSQIRIK